MGSNAKQHKICQVQQICQETNRKHRPMTWIIKTLSGSQQNHANHQITAERIATIYITPELNMTNTHVHPEYAKFKCCTHPHNHDSSIPWYNSRHNNRMHTKREATWQTVRPIPLPWGCRAWPISPLKWEQDKLNLIANQATWQRWHHGFKVHPWGAASHPACTDDN
jgi:hypothetical protein